MALLLGVPTAGAETKPPVLLYCTAYSADVKSVFVGGKGGANSEVGLSIANVVELPEAPIEDGKITLFGAAGKNGERPVVAIAETAGLKRPLIVLSPSGKEDGPAYLAIAVDANIKAFPLASFQLVNLSPHAIRISRDDAEPFELEPQKTRIFAPKGSVGKPLAIKVDYKAGDHWALLSSSSWVARRDRRTLVCIQLDPLTERMNLKSVPLREIPDR